MSKCRFEARQKDRSERRQRSRIRNERLDELGRQLEEKRFERRRLEQEPSSALRLPQQAAGRVSITIFWADIWIELNVCHILVGAVDSY